MPGTIASRSLNLANPAQLTEYMWHPILFSLKALTARSAMTLVIAYLEDTDPI